jgi:hypothetical protein
MVTTQKPQQDPAEKPIVVINTPPMTLTFSEENQAIIKEMIAAKYGENEKDLIINALTILYTIAKKAPNAKEISVQGENSPVLIPITRVP